MNKKENKSIKIRYDKNYKTTYFIILIMFFIFFFMIGKFVPLTGDDFGNYSKGMTLKQSLQIAEERWHTLEGRFISRTLLAYLTPRNTMWAFINSLALTIILFCLNKIINSKNKILMLILTIFSIVNINTLMYRQTYLWIAGSCTYLLGIPLIMLYFTYMDKIFKGKIEHKKINYVIFGIINFISTMFIENMAMALVVANILYLIYTIIKYKNIDKMVLICLITSVIGTLLMILAPGVVQRIGLTPKFEELTLFEKIINNIPRFTYYSIACNAFTLILATIFINKFLKCIIKEKKLKKQEKILNFTKKIINIFTGINIIFLLLKIMPFSIRQFNFENKVLNIFISNDSLIYNSFFIIYILLIVIGMIYYAVKENKWNNLFYTLVAFSSLAVMLPIATWGERVSLFETLVLFIPLFRSIDLEKYFEKKYKIKYVILILLLLENIYLYTNVYYSVYRHNQFRENEIYSAVENKEKVIPVYAFPYSLLWNSEPWDSYHAITFKTYYGIKENQEIEILHGTFRYRTIIGDIINKYINSPKLFN